MAPIHEVVDDLDDAPFEARRVQRRASARPRQSETSTTRDVLKELNARPRHRFQKMHQSGLAGSGEPDLDGCVNGRCVKIEMKAEGNRPLAKQDRRLRQWQDAGALVGWARNLGEVDEILSHLDDPHYRYDGQPGDGRALPLRRRTGEHTRVIEPDPTGGPLVS